MSFPRALVRLVRLEAAPLSVPLREPFLIATARVERTQSVCVTAELEDTSSGGRATGLGEAAALPPVTREDVPMILDRVARAADALDVTPLGDQTALGRALDDLLGDVPVARAGVETALLDALSRLRGIPLATLIGSSDRAAVGATVLETDVTIPIADLDRMVSLARQWRALGFRALKVKVGRDPEHDLRALAALGSAVPDARLRLDANAAFDARTALSLLDGALSRGVDVELFEQPCARDDLAAMAEVTARSRVPVVADESIRTLADLDAVVQARAAHAVNLKLGKHGGLLAAVAIGRAARAHGFRVMAGAMVETRLGLSAMAHVVAALGGADWIDLDTALLLADDPFDGGYVADGPSLTLTGAPGHGVCWSRT